MTTHAMPVRRPARRARDHVARVLLLLAALGALVSTITATGDVAGATGDTKVVEAWRLFGFAMFTGLFALLAWRPRGYPGVWELAILNKLGLAVFGAAAGAAALLWIDGGLAVLLVVAYGLAKGYRAWQPARRRRTQRGLTPAPGRRTRARPASRAARR